MMRDKQPAKTGEIAAALCGVWLGCAAMTAAHWWSVANPLEANAAMLKLGVWMPGWWGIGPYAGKQTAGLIGWLGGWLIGWLALRQRDISVRRWSYGFAAGFALVLLALWPPVYHALLGWHPAMP